MTTVLIINEAEVIEPADLTEISTNARDGDEEIVGGAIGYPHHWAGIAAAVTSAVEVTLSAGGLFVGEVVYRNDQPTPVDLLARLPLIAGDTVWVALLLRGSETTETAQRLVETDVDTHETVQQAVEKRVRRTWSVVVQSGVPGPTPLKPTVAATECVIAWALLATTGIQSIEMDAASRLRSLHEVEGRLTAVEGDLSAVRRRTTTLETDVANLAARLGEIPDPIIIRQLKRDAALMRRQLALPAEARAYWYDAGLLTDAWDLTHASWLARVREGIRFSWAHQSDSQLALLDPGASTLRLYGTLLMPAWHEVTRLEVPTDGSSVNISQQVHTVVTGTRREISRQVTEYGQTVTVCENNAEWAMTRGLSVGALFARAGETFEVVSINGGSPDHVWRGVRSIITRTVTDVYWDYVTETFGLNGAVNGQTLLCSQPQIVTSIDLLFTRVGSTGDVHLALAECRDDGSPRFDRVIARTTVAAGDLALGWVKFALRPSLIESGRRYAWFVVTTGNHALATVSGNSFAQGSRFVCSDGVWSQVLADSDFAFRINTAEFDATRTTIKFQPIVLENGMTELKILTAGWAPGGTSLVWQIKPSGAPDWLDLTVEASDGGAALAGLPALCELQAVAVGTTSLAPAIILDATARSYAFRPRGDMRAVSIVHDFGLSTTSIQVEAVLDAFDAAKHTAALRLIIGATVYTPSVTQIIPDLVNPKKRTLLASFSVPATTSARAEIDMNTTEVTDVPFVQNAAMYAL